MRSSSSGDVDLLFVALHQASLQCSQNSFTRYQMSRGLYFYDQFTRVSHLGGIPRYKRHPEELNQALHHVRVVLATEDGDAPKTITPATTINPTPSPVKLAPKETNEGLLRTIQRKLNAPIVPDALFQELDLLLEPYNDKNRASSASSSTPKLPSSIASKSRQSAIHEQDQQETDGIHIQEAEDEDELIAPQTNTPKISLPASLIIALHSTWTDLIENTEYKYKTWRTKAGEDSWRRHLEYRRSGKMNAAKQRIAAGIKQANRRRIGSRSNLISVINLSRQQHALTANPQMRSNRSVSRVSFLTTSNISQLESSRLLKPIYQGSSESLTESVKSGMHVEFKLSTQVDEIKQQSYIQTINEHKGVTFEVPKPSIDVYDDVIVLIQAKCKRLLAEMKQKISNTGIDDNSKICKVWFYGENQHIRNKTNLLTLNESAKRRRSKFIFSLLRRTIPERYNIDIVISENKHKSLLELIDGSIQIYYPSGRLAVLRLKPPNTCTIFFDDTNIPENEFLGLVTSTGSAVIMQPNLNARFTTDNHHERAYLCDGKTGIIQKQIQWNMNISGNQSVLSNQTGSNDDDDILPPLMDNTVQLQLNSSMQFEYHNPTNIRFAFASQKEEYKFQLGTNISSQLPRTPEPIIHLSKKKNQSKLKSSPIITNSHEIPFVMDKQQIQLERLLDGQVNIKELPMIKELYLLRKKIRNICNNWLKECRIILGVMDIDSYCLPDWPSGSIIKYHQSKSAKSPRHIIISSKHDDSTTNNKEFLQPSERERILRRYSARKADTNIKSDTMTQFVHRSNSAKVKINTKKKHLPSINKIEGNFSPRIIIPLDLPFACPNLIRQRFIQDGPISPILYDTCTCRADHVPLIHDLEFDTFIQLTNDLNGKQLIVIGIINSNLRQIENEESNELYQILQTLHYHINYGRSQLCSCRLSTNDDYRCLIYDLSEATKQSSLYGPLLVKRHHVQPGFVLIYQHGKLIFGDSIFNGYGRNVQDLKKQLNHMGQQQTQSIALPEEFKFVSDHQRTNTTILKSI